MPFPLSWVRPKANGGRPTTSSPRHDLPHGSLQKSRGTPTVYRIDGQLSARGTPVSALFVSAFGLALAAIVTKIYPTSAFVYFAGITLFAIMFVWQMVFVTHLLFRRKWLAQGRSLSVRMIGYPFTSILGLVLVTAILVATCG